MAYSDTILAIPSLVAYWRLEELAGTFNDSEGTDHVTPTGLPLRGWRGAGGIGGYGAHLGSTGTYVGTSTVNSSFAGAIEAWVLPLGVPAANVVFMLCGAVTVTWNSTGTLTLTGFRDPTGTIVANSAASPWVLGQWNHVAAAWGANGVDLAAVNLYVNGTSVAYGSAVTANMFMVGAAQFGGTGQTNVAMDELAIYGNGYSHAASNHIAGRNIPSGVVGDEPYVVGVSRSLVTDSKLILQFSEPMAASGLTTNAKYTFSPAGPTTTGVSTVTGLPVPTAVEITTTGFAANTAYTVSVDTSITDYAGNAPSSSDQYKAVFTTLQGAPTGDHVPYFSVVHGIANGGMQQHYPAYRGEPRPLRVSSDSTLKVLFLMRGLRTAPSVGYVYWQVQEFPDPLGLYAPPGTITDIVVEETYVSAA